jgi:UDP-N-acetylmuramoylalanine--D-glutamate ligase
MEIDRKKVLVIGLALSGISTVKVLASMGAQVTVNDKRDRAQLQQALKELEEVNAKYELGHQGPELAEEPDFAVVSPGVPTDIPLIRELRRRNKEVINEIELSYRLTKTPIVAITGTNGKTTTTALTGRIFKESGRGTHIVGNIGKPVISAILEAQEEHVLVAEISSFQLETVKCFRPVAAAILNLTPDHLDRHKTFENYIALKARVFENQGPGDHIVLNADDPETVALADRCRSKVTFFSRNRALDVGVFIEGGYIVVGDADRKHMICRADSLKIPGAHNLENALAAVALTWSMGVKPEAIARGLSGFEGVEHRLERVAVINDIAYINDSKGTNTDASIKAIQAIKGPIILIAGGYDKGSGFEELVDNFKDRVKAVVLLGQTADRIKKTCQNKNFVNIYIVEDMEDAVRTATSIARPGDTVLLSPACASWDMYKNFEERGRVFKGAVEGLRRI